ncbi:MAG TPA: PEP-CTERM sorting domain-containing protein [Lacunisphaera sp.]|jgi:hypothetical protein
MKLSSTLLRAGAVVALGLVGAGTAWAQASTLYGITFFDNQLIKIDPATGSGSLVASLSDSVSPYGVGFLGQKLYTFDSGTDSIREINRSTGAVSSSINIGVSNILGEGDLAFRSDGIGFLSSALTSDFNVANDLYKFDLTSGTSMRIGTTDVVLDGMVFVGNKLYAIGQEADATLYLVDQNTAALTAVGSLGIQNNSPFAALTVDASGQLFGAINDRLYSIDKTTGLASELNADVLDTGYGSVSGLAFSPASPLSAVPEPSTYGIVGAGMLMLVSYVRKKRTQTKTATVAG